MKNILLSVLNILNKLALLFNTVTIDLKSNTFRKFFIKASSNNQFDFFKTKLEKTWIRVNGVSNKIVLKNALISNSSFTVTGNNNTLLLSDGVKLNNSTFIIRGNNCSVSIGQNTSFGGIRIINVGESNSVTIGDNCLFADHVELWASDTHPIFDDNHSIINKEKPVNIGNKVWVGSKVIMLKGTVIADGAIVGMGTLVVNDIPEKSISVGNPNRVVRTNVTWSL